MLTIIVMGATLTDVRASPVPLESFRLEADEVAAIVALEPAWREVMEARIAQYNAACAEVIESHATCRRWLRSTGTETLSFIHLRASVELAEELRRLADASVAVLRDEERSLARDLGAVLADGSDAAFHGLRVELALRAYRLDDDGRLDRRVFGGRPGFVARAMRWMGGDGADDERHLAFTAHVRTYFDAIDAAPYDTVGQWESASAAQRVSHDPPMDAKRMSAPAAEGIVATIELRAVAIGWLEAQGRAGMDEDTTFAIECGLTPLTDADIDALAQPSRRADARDQIRSLARERSPLRADVVRESVRASCGQLLRGRPIARDVIEPLVGAWSDRRLETLRALRAVWETSE